MTLLPGLFIPRRSAWFCRPRVSSRSDPSPRPPLPQRGEGERENSRRDLLTPGRSLLDRHGGRGAIDDFHPVVPQSLRLRLVPLLGSLVPPPRRIDQLLLDPGEMALGLLARCELLASNPT